MINKIQSNDIAFNAKLYTYPKTTTVRQVFNSFEERTAKYPDLILKQDNISFFDEDQFLLLKENKVLAFGTYSYTNNHPKTLYACIDRYVKIFEDLILKTNYTNL